MGRHPAPTPLAHRAIRGANRLGDLLVVPLRMFMDSQDDPSTKRHDLRCRMGSDELLKRLDFFSGQVNWMSGLGTTHWFHLPLSVYLLLFLLSKAERTYDCLYLVHILVYVGSALLSIIIGVSIYRKKPTRNNATLDDGSEVPPNYRIDAFTQIDLRRSDRQSQINFRNSDMQSKQAQQRIEWARGQALKFVDETYVGKQERARLIEEKFAEYLKYIEGN
jgi:hypothetical protein